MSKWYLYAEPLDQPGPNLFGPKTLNHSSLETRGCSLAITCKFNGYSAMLKPWPVRCEMTSLEGRAGARHLPMRAGHRNFPIQSLIAGS